MSHIERIIGDPATITRREAIKGAVTVVISAILASGIGTFAISSIEKAKKYITTRIGGLYSQDAGMTLRVSHANPEVITLYETFLSPGAVAPAESELSHRLLHTVYGSDVEHHIAHLKEVSIEEAIEETDASYLGAAHAAE
ncbi:MAG: iron hydrogenase small subunit [Eggerthellaceae bacterium]|nr:iron hydrogenase small subunit [Eggerthellaceae bacterium]